MMEDSHSSQGEQNTDHQPKRRTHQGVRGGITDRMSHLTSAKRNSEQMDEVEEGSSKKKAREYEPDSPPA